MKPLIVILAAGRPFVGKVPSDQRLIDRRRNVLEWQLDALAPLAGDVEVIVGYDAAHFADSGHRYLINDDWATTGSAFSLFLANIDSGRDLVFCYSDILFRPDIVRRLLLRDDSISVAIDSMRRGKPRPTRESWVNPSGATGAQIGRVGSVRGESSDLIGLVRVPARFVPELLKLRPRVAADLRTAHMGLLLQCLLDAKAPVHSVDVAGDWTDLDDGASLARFLFGTKAETLARLAQRIVTATVQPQVSFTVRRWLTDRTQIVADVMRKFKGRKLAVRSSSLNEDGFLESNAGRYLSLLEIASEASPIAQAVESVIASFDEEGGHQILVQPMVRDVIASGVVLTRTLSHGAPYYVVNFTLGSSTDDVTSGRSKQYHLAYVHRNSVDVAPAKPIDLPRLLAVILEIETLTDLDALDIEFAISRDGAISVLQVRPLVQGSDRARNDDGQLLELLVQARDKFIRLEGPVSGALGRRSIFGVMPDWNPAEIIGSTPSPLAASLYRFLILDDVWARQRSEFGYRDLRPAPLLHDFAGHPYVDVRASINSFIPASLKEVVALRLVEAAIERLAENPQLHDKIEFDVIPTCYDLDFDRWRDHLFLGAGLTESEVAEVSDAYVAITRGSPAICEASWSSILAYEDAIHVKLRDSFSSPLDRMSEILEACRQTATPAFAHLARCGFVAISLLKTAVSRGVVGSDRVDQFLSSVRTISHDFRNDGIAVARNELAFETFAEKYGHLRPGTYDIESPAYRDDVNAFLRPSVEYDGAAQPDIAFEWSDDECSRWRQACDTMAWDISIDDLSSFMRRAIEGREYAKFVFTKALSISLDLISGWGLENKFTRNDLACLEIFDLLAAAKGRALENLSGRIKDNRQRWKVATEIELPLLLCKADDIFAFVAPAVRPNFITRKRLTAPPLLLGANASTIELQNRIILIDRADPGFDWLFTRGIAALVTAYGGANSHMAIRCAEFGIPAAIGVGVAQLERLSAATLIELNCETGQLTVLQ